MFKRNTVVITTFVHVLTLLLRFQSYMEGIFFFFNHKPELGCSYSKAFPFWMVISKSYLSVGLTDIITKMHDVRPVLFSCRRTQSTHSAVFHTPTEIYESVHMLKELQVYALKDHTTNVARVLSCSRQHAMLCCWSKLLIEL